MPIRRKSSIEKKYYETIGQGLLFGHDNLRFKTVNLPQKQRLTNLCKKFSIKQIDQSNPFFFTLFLRSLILIRTSSIILLLFSQVIMVQF